MVDNPRWSLTKGDALEWLRGLGAASADMAILDPPWASMDKHFKGGIGRKSMRARWFGSVSNDYLLEAILELYRVAKPGSHAYVFLDQTTAFWLVPRLLDGRELGDHKRGRWTVWKALVWVKRPGLGMGYHYRAQHELILFLEKGTRKLADLGLPDVLEHKPFRGGWSPAEKPVPLLVDLIRQSSGPDDLVIDPFAGAGSVGVACEATGRLFAGCEIHEATYNEARSRLEDVFTKPAD